MKITITMDLTQENLDKLRALLPDTQIPGQTEFDTPFKHVDEPALQPETKKHPEVPVGEPAPEEKVTKTDIRAVALKLSKAGKQKELAAAFAKFGCKKLSDFDARPDDYPALMKELVSIDG